MFGNTKSHLAATSLDIGAMHSILKDIEYRFDRMYAHRAYVHWFVGVGMSSGEYSYKREELAALVRDYEELGTIVTDKNESENEHTDFE